MFSINLTSFTKNLEPRNATLKIFIKNVFYEFQENINMVMQILRFIV